MIIRVKNLRLDGSLGVYDWEKDFKRGLVFNAELEIDDETSMKSDDVSDTVDYDKITSLIKNYVNDNHCHLIEKMVSDILDLILAIDQRIKRCTLEIDKLKVYDFVDSFSVTKTKIR